MSLEKFLGKKKSELQEMSDDEMVTAFKDQTADRNITYPKPEKMSLVFPMLAGTSLGFLTYHLTKSRRTP